MIPIPVGRNGGRSVQRISAEKDGVDADVGHDDADDGDNDDVVGVDVAAGRPDVSERDGNDRRRRSVDRRSELDEKPTQGRTIQVKDQLIVRYGQVINELELSVAKEDTRANQ